MGIACGEVLIEFKKSVYSVRTYENSQYKGRCGYRISSTKKQRGDGKQYLRKTGAREKWSQFNPRIVRRLALMAKRIVRGRRFVLSEKRVLWTLSVPFSFPNYKRFGRPCSRSQPMHAYTPLEHPRPAATAGHYLTIQPY